MTNKLKQLMNACAISVTIDIDDHKSYYETAEQHINDLIEKRDLAEDEISEDVKAEMIKRNTIICIQFYPHTPVGFYFVYHYDLDKALDKALEIINNDK